MAMYDYFCEANGQTVEVRHRMSESFSTWGEICEQMSMPLGDTPADAPVEKLLGTGSRLNEHNTFSYREKPRPFDSGTVLPMRDNKW